MDIIKAMEKEDLLDDIRHTYGPLLARRVRNVPSGIVVLTDITDEFGQHIIAMATLDESD
jgi:hypothetical protein